MEKMTRENAQRMNISALTLEDIVDKLLEYRRNGISVVTEFLQPHPWMEGDVKCDLYSCEIASVEDAFMEAYGCSRDEFYIRCQACAIEEKKRAGIRLNTMRYMQLLYPKYWTLSEEEKKELEQTDEKFIYEHIDEIDAYYQVVKRQIEGDAYEHLTGSAALYQASEMLQNADEDTKLKEQQIVVKAIEWIRERHKINEVELNGITPSSIEQVTEGTTMSQFQEETDAIGKFFNETKEAPREGVDVGDE